jgi:flagellar assembly protein FliH
MNLSKIYRGTEAQDLQPFQFRSFGGAEPASSLTPGAQNSAAAVVAPVAASAKRPEQEINEAYAKGKREGMAAAQAQFNTSAQALAQALEEVSRLRQILAENSKQDMLRLVMAVSEQVIRREVTADPQVIVGIIENALQSSVRADHYRVRVNPDDLGKVSERKPLFLASISGLKNLSIESDSSISPGGCRVDSDLGEVDATLETQLEAIQKVLSEAIADL